MADPLEEAIYMAGTVNDCYQCAMALPREIAEAVRVYFSTILDEEEKKWEELGLNPPRAAIANLRTTLNIDTPREDST